MGTNLVQRIFVASFVAFMGTAVGAEIAFSGINDGGCEQFKGSSACITISFEGRIEPGDAAKFDAEVRRMTAVLKDAKLRARVGVVHFNSPGGDVHEAMRIGRAIRVGVMATSVPPNSACYSSCVLAIVGGVIRAQPGNVGIHSFYSKAFLGTEEFAAASEQYNRISAEIERYLTEMRVSTALLDEMRKIRHDKIRLLDLDERARLGIFGADPVYLQTRSGQSKAK